MRANLLIRSPRFDLASTFLSASVLMTFPTVSMNPLVFNSALVTFTSYQGDDTISSIVCCTWITKLTISKLADTTLSIMAPITVAMWILPHAFLSSDPGFLIAANAFLIVHGIPATESRTLQTLRVSDTSLFAPCTPEAMRSSDLTESVSLLSVYFSKSLSVRLTICGLVTWRVSWAADHRISRIVR